MKKACFCGTFDPVTQGHLDLIQRATRLFDEVVVVIGVNSEKHTMFPLDQRKQWLEEALKNFSHVSVQAHAGLGGKILFGDGALTVIYGAEDLGAVQLSQLHGR